MRTEAYIQARMGSTRLPGKVLKAICKKPLLDYVIERVSQAKEIDGIVILTTERKEDDIIASYCLDKGISLFRGADEDVLDRYYQAAKERRPDAIVRITSDCPLIDPEVVDQVISVYKQNYPAYDYVSNTLERTFPRGLDVEIFSYKALQEAAGAAALPEEREHVTLHLYRHPEKFKLHNIAHSPNLGFHRWTVDTPEDLSLIKLILEDLYPKNSDFRFGDVLQVLTMHPEWNELNSKIEQKKL